LPIANWWFLEFVVGSQCCHFHTVYCQFIVIPQMIQERKQLLLLDQNNPDALLLVEQASNLSWNESFRGLLEYLQLVEKGENDRKEEDKFQPQMQWEL
jgi:hypothetical protein